MQRKVVFAEGEYYHLYNRGVDKRRIFTSEQDWRRFVKLLYLANGENKFIFRDVENKSPSEVDRGRPLVAIGAYVLMPNHFHILVKEIRKNGMSDFMEKLLTGYAAYFNKRHNRTGTLFQGTFQAQHLKYDEYLKYIFAYIHLNPVKLIDSKWKERGITDTVTAKKYLDKYRYSSYTEYKGQAREESLILSRDAFPAYFVKARNFDEFLEDWLTYKENQNT